MTLEADLRWRAAFEADRAARGVPPSGFHPLEARARRLAAAERPGPILHFLPLQPQPILKVVAKPVRPKYQKHYPRTRISRSPAGTWVIDYLAAEGAKPDRQKPSFVNVKFAYRAAARITQDGPPRKRSPHGQRVDPGTCKTCNWPMRHVGTKAAHHPNTRLRAREGLCQTCDARAKRQAERVRTR